MILKRYLPRSLFGRALLILAAPVVLIQALAAVAIVERHYDAVTRQMAGVVASEINFAIAQVEGAPDGQSARDELLQMTRLMGVRFELEEGRVVPRETLRAFYDVTGGAAEQALKEDVRRPMTLDLVSFRSQVEARVQTDKGVLAVRIARNRLSASNPHQIFVWMAGASLLFVTVATIFLRNQVRPIRELAAAAEAFGKGRPVKFHPAGADEVRRAGAAFLDMRRRIERQIESRTLMLSGVSHDMRTPLTRMKLALAMMEDAPEAEELRQDVVDMERMLDAFLAFARDEAGEEAVPTDAAALAEQLAAAARRRGGDVELRLKLDPPDDRAATFRAGAVERAVQNLLDNACAYGGRVTLTLRTGPAFVEFEVEDDGPGIAPQDRETAVKPFTRLDSARNQDLGGGVGLGLSIAADVARTHGGALILGDSARLGGLSARLRLPR
jgi:two-component system osmolarity sensor histidine kinase EnvZ